MNSNYESILGTKFYNQLKICIINQLQSSSNVLDSLYYIDYIAYTLSRAYRKTKVLSEYVIVSFQRVMTKGSVGEKANFRNLLDPGQLALVDIFTTFWT